jgi:hypothetical protein
MHRDSQQVQFKMRIILHSIMFLIAKAGSIPETCPGIPRRSHERIIQWNQTLFACGILQRYVYDASVLHDYKLRTFSGHQQFNSFVAELRCLRFYCRGILLQNYVAEYGFRYTSVLLQKNLGSSAC